NSHERGDGKALASRSKALRRKSPHAGHSRESGNPASPGLTWTPACAGVTTTVIFILIGGPQAHDHSVVRAGSEGKQSPQDESPPESPIRTIAARLPQTPNARNDSGAESASVSSLPGRNRGSRR